MFKSIKAKFNNAWSILIARVTMLAGLIIAVIPAIPFEALASGVQAGWTWTQGLMYGGIMFMHGLVSEIGRRSGTVTLSDGNLIPTDISEKKEAIAVIKETATKKQKETL